MRVVLGHVGTADDGYEPGLELFDRQGSCRASLAVRGWGPLLDFGVDGNGVFALGVRDDSEFPDDSPHYDPVTYVDFCDGEGNARLSLEVHHDGRVEMQTPNEANPADATPQGAGGPG